MEKFLNIALPPKGSFIVVIMNNYYIIRSSDQAFYSYSSGKPTHFIFLPWFLFHKWSDWVFVCRVLKQPDSSFGKISIKHYWVKARWELTKSTLHAVIWCCKMHCRGPLVHINTCGHHTFKWGNTVPHYAPMQRLRVCCSLFRNKITQLLLTLKIYLKQTKLSPNCTLGYYYSFLDPFSASQRSTLGNIDLMSLSSSFV